MSCESRCLHSPRPGAGRLEAVLIMSLPQSAEQQIWMSAAPPRTRGLCGATKGPTQVSPLVFAFLLSLTTSHVSIITPCPQLQIEPPLHPISRPSSVQPWKSTPNEQVKISAIMNSPGCSRDASLRIRSSLYLKNNPTHLMNSGIAIQS